MISKIINNYLTNSLIEKFKIIALIRGIDLLCVPAKNEVLIYAKHKKYNSNYYKKIMILYKNESIYYLCNLKFTEEQFIKILLGEKKISENNECKRDV